MDSGPSVLRVKNFDLVVLEDAGEGENIAYVIIHHQYGLVSEYRVRAPDFLKETLLLCAEVGLASVQEDDGLVEQPVHGGSVPNRTGVQQHAQPVERRS